MDHIAQMKVDDVYFLVRRLGADCDDYQQYRELTQNGIEAVLRARQQGLLAPDAGEVIWDIDWLALEATGTYRACVSDNGDGMTDSHLRKYINHLSSSGGVQSLVANYGVGAKIAAATRNPKGLVYQSWKNGAGVLAQLVIDEEARKVGFFRWEVEDGVWKDILDDLKSDMRPDPISDHGVSVSLIGTHERDNTFLGPERSGTPYKTWWLFRTLNRRYFQLPVSVKVRVFDTWDPDKWPKSKESVGKASLMRTVFGQSHYLERYSIASGTVQLSGATARYYVMDPEKGFDQRQFFEPGGHVAALYQGELYEMRNGNPGRKLLQNFGAVFSSRHVVIYVEPDSDLGCITTNTARTELVLDGKSLPWMDWGDEFRQNLPGEIKELELEIADRGTSTSHNDSIKERLKKIRTLYRVTRYRPTPDGAIEAEIETIGNNPRPTTRSRMNRSHTRSAGSGGRAGSEYLAARRSGGATAEQVETHCVEPRTTWISCKDRSRSPGQIEDRAAEYVRGDHLILINADFRVFTDMIAHFEKTYAQIPGAKATIEETVHEWFEQQLMEAVMGVRAIEGSRLWKDDQIQNALSEEALTTAVMPRYHTWESVKRVLGRKLGSQAEAANS